MWGLLYEARCSSGVDLVGSGEHVLNGVLVVLYQCISVIGVLV